MNGYPAGGMPWQQHQIPNGNAHGTQNYPPYQQPAYGQLSFQQPQYGQNGQIGQHGQNGYGQVSQQGYQSLWQNSPDNPPPFKKARSNTVITRYAPPPGYQGPAQAGQPYQPPGGISLPSAAYYAQQSYQGTPVPPNFAHQRAQSLGQPQLYGTPPIQQGYHQQPPSTGYIAHQHFSFGQYSRSQAAFPAPAQAHSVPLPPLPWHANRNVSLAPPNDQPGTMTLSNQHSMSVVTDGNGDPVSPIRSVKVGPGFGEAEEDDEHPFIYQSPFYKELHEISEALSLGEITSRTALPTKRALPSTFIEAELEALAPLPMKPGEDEFISKYFIGERAEEAFLSVRQTDDWEEIKSDVIFREYSQYPREIIPIEQLKEQYQKREDPSWIPPKPPSRSPTPWELTPRPETPPARPTGVQEDVGAEMEADSCSQRDDSLQAREQVSMQQSFEPPRYRTDMLGNFEQALSSTEGLSGQRQSLQIRQEVAHPPLPQQSYYPTPVSGEPPEARCGSQQPQYQSNFTKPEPLFPIKDLRQEKILAALGVSGSPKVVYQTPVPALGAPRYSTSASNSRRGSVVSATGSYGGLHIPPPPPMVGRSSSSDDPWKIHGFDPKTDSHVQGVKRPGSSTSSHHTAIGSDFDFGDRDATPRPRPTKRPAVYGTEDYGQLNRKRAHEESVLESPRKAKDEDDGATPKASRSKARKIDPIYGRRW